MMINRLILFFIIISLCSCGEKKKSPSVIDSMNSGKVEVFCDSSYLFAMDSVFKMYAERYPKVELIINYVSSRSAKSHLLSGKTNVAIVGRDYLKDEDSLMQQYNVSDFHRMDIANDGLVFFVQANFPLDTINTSILTEHFTNHKKLQTLLKSLPFEPEFVIAEPNSSEYGNFVNLVCKQNKVSNHPKLLPNTDSVLEYVKANSNAIGICYLSQVQGKFYKILRVGYNDSVGQYVPATKPPHQSFIVMGEYPYTTTLRLYLQDDRKSLPFFWLGAFCEGESVAVNYYHKKRLVPFHATYQLEDQRRPRR